MEYSSFNEALSIILEESNYYSLMMEETHYIQEVSFSEYIRKIDFKKIIKFIFEKFVGIIKAIWDRFRAAYHQYTQKSSLLKRYRRKLENIDWDVNIDFDRSVFTNLDSSTNINMYKMILIAQYGSLMGELENISKIKDISSLYSKIVDIKNNMEPLEDFLDQKRGEILGSRSIITKEDFAKAAVEYYKPDTKIPAGIIHPSETKQITKEYFESKTMEKSINKDNDFLSSYSKDMQNKISSVDFSKFVKTDNVNIEITNIFTQIIREYCNRVQGICNIYVQLFSIKLDIFKIYKQEQVQVLSKIILNSMKEGKM